MKLSKRSFEETQRLFKKHLPSLKGGENQILEDFVRTYGFGNNHIDMFNKFLDEHLPSTIKSFSGTVKTVTGSIVAYDNIIYEKPYYIDEKGNKRPLTPRNARDRGINYEFEIFCDILELSPDESLIVSRINKVFIGRMPLMLMSKLCHLSGITSRNELKVLGEDPDDPFGYFIVLGNEKVLLLQEQLIYDKIINHQDDKYFTSRLTCTIPMATRLIEFSQKRDKSESRIFKARLQNLNIKEEGKKTKYNAFNVISLFGLLGMTNSLDIINLVASYMKPENIHLTKKLFPSIWDAKVINNDVDLIIKKYQKAQTKKILESRSDLSRLEFTNEEKLNIVDGLLHSDVFPNLNNLPIKQGETEHDRYNRIRITKVNGVASMLARLIELSEGVRKADDPDSWSNKRLEGPARLCETLLRAIWRKSQYPPFSKKRAEGFDSALGNVVSNLTELVSRFKQMNLFAQSFQDSFNTSNWGVKGTGKFKKNYSQTLQRESPYQTWAHIYTVDVSVSRTNHKFLLRMPHDTAQYFIDSVFTSEGAPCGLLKNLAIGTILSQQSDDTHIIRYLYGDIDGKPLTFQVKDTINNYQVYVNSKPIGWCEQNVYNKIRDMKRFGLLPFDISIYAKSDFSINIETSASRLMRPVLIVNPQTQKLVLFEKHKSTDIVSFNQLLTDGSVEFISPTEQEQPFVKIAEDGDMINARLFAINDATTKLISVQTSIDKNEGKFTEDDLFNFKLNLIKVNKESPFSHCQIDKTMIMGFVSATIPKPECNQGPRNVYAGQMTKQSTSCPHVNHKSIHSFQTYKTTEAAVKPLFMTNAVKYLNLEEKGSGYNPNLWMKITPETEEDAWKLERDYLLLGGFRSVKWSTYSSKIDSKGIYAEKFEKLDNMNASYRFIQPNGIIYIGAPVYQSDVVISKIRTAKSRQIKDPTVLNISEQGVVIGVKTTRHVTKEMEISVKIAWTRIPQKGDKLAPRNAQKGTDGAIVPHWLLPFARNGSGPSINPSALCLPTRMTMEYIYEILAGNVAATTCEFVNATAFNKHENHFKYRKILRDNNRNEWCLVDAYSGTSSKPLNGKIYCGLTHIMALKHHVDDKIQARSSSGQRSEVNNQPTGGRKKNGGLRFGEMEHDSIIAHGASACTKHFLMDASDPFTTVYCKCGRMADYDPSIGKYRKCGKHADEREFGVFTIPYSYKYLSQILQSANMDLEPEFITLKEFSERLINGTLYNNDKFIGDNIEEDLEDFEGNSDIGDAIRDQNIDDEDMDEGEDYDEDTGDYE